MNDHPAPLGLAHFTCLEASPLELVGLAARAGYKSIGLRLHPAFQGSPFYEVPRGSAVSRELKARLNNKGVTVYDIEFVTVGEDFSAAALEGLLEDAADLGAKRISICGDDTDRLRLASNFAALCDLADHFALGVDLECMPWRAINDLNAAADVVQKAGRANGGVLVDALHLSRSGGAPDLVAALPPQWVRSVQLCDAAAAKPKTRDDIIREARSQRLPPGEGALPLGELLKSLPANVALSVEIPMEGHEPVDVRLRRIFDATQSLLAARCAA